MTMGPQGLRPESEIQILRAKEEARVVERAPRKEPETPAEWLKQNLFSSPFNSLLTIAVGLFVAWFSFRIFRWILTGADWTVVKQNLRVYMIGRFPLRQVWRIWTVVYLLVLLSGVSYGMTGVRLLSTPRRNALRGFLGLLALAILVYLVDTPLMFLLLAGIPALLMLGIVIGRRAGRARLARPVMWAWVAAFPLAMVIFQAFGGVPPRLWGGFFLNIVLAVVGIFASFPIGLLLALGRRSTLPVIRAFCVGFIEIMRGAPLVTWLIFGWLVLPLVLPPQLDFPLIMRTMIMITIFSAAYVAEIVRGGLQGVDRGQYEAGTALALSYPSLMGRVILPQALRSTIPAMVGHFISLFKDTSLVIVLGLSDLLRTARRSAVSLEFQGRQREALLFAALVFFIAAFSMSRWSQRLEARLGLGER
jgi:general L-amino acid transport system permease protein